MWSTATCRLILWSATTRRRLVAIYEYANGDESPHSKPRRTQAIEIMIDYQTMENLYV